MAECTKKWEEIAREYRRYIRLEKNLSPNTVECYMRDLAEFAHFVLRMYDVPPQRVEPQMIERYMAWLYDQGRRRTSQARRLSGIKSFYNYLLLGDRIDTLPTEFVESPKFGRTLPDVLTVEEVDRIISVIDISTAKGIRDSAMLEVLYSCGLRVSELTSLRLGDLFFGEGYIRIVGKGDKERIVPVSSAARDKVQLYMERRKPRRDSEDTLFPQGRPYGRHRQAHKPPYVPPLLCDASVGGWREHPSGTGVARSRKHNDHRDIYACRPCAAARNDRRQVRRSESAGIGLDTQNRKTI